MSHRAVGTGSLMLCFVLIGLVTNIGSAAKHRWLRRHQPAPQQNGPGTSTPPIGAPTNAAIGTPISQTDIPYSIVKPGFYYLTENVKGTVDNHGIQVIAADVTIDLNGFVLEGVLGSTSGITGKGSPPTSTNTTIRNGTIRGWGKNGIDLGHGHNKRLLDLTLMENKGIGISCGPDSIVRECSVVSSAAGRGMQLQGNTTVEHCTVRGGTTGIGITQFPGDGSGVIRNCTVADADSGIRALEGVQIESCNVSGCKTWIDVSTGSMILKCVVKKNADFGIKTNLGCTVDNCTGSYNGVGIHVSTGSTVKECTLRFNLDDAIQLDGPGIAIRNHCTSNGISSMSQSAAGIRAARGSVVTENRVANNVNGIVASRSHVFKNVATRNTKNNYTLSDCVAGEVIILDKGEINASHGAWANFATP